MDKIFGSFSIQHFLRQFFCGVVFFVACYQHATTLSLDGLRPLTSGAGFSTADLVILGILSCIVGTIIYHLEKNVYSYALQCLFEKIGNKRWLGVMIFIVACIGCLTMLFTCYSNYGFSSTRTCFVIILTISIILVTCFSLCKDLLDSVRKQWVAEEKATNMNEQATVFVEHRPEGENGAEVYAAARRISKWSDYIHCVQTCCFAYLLGSLPYMLKFSDNPCFEYGMIIPFGILLLEAFVDWHRYQHVMYILGRTKKTEK